MIPKELAKKIRRLQITTNRTVNDVLAGAYESVFKGQGMEFDEVREYQPGDEVRSIDWNVTARMGHPFIKRFQEERELTVVFLVDLSASGAFGSGEQLKNEVAAEFCALLAFSAIKNNDKVGLIIFTDCIEMFIPPGKGVTHVLRLIRDLLQFRPRQARTDVAGALDYLGRVVRKRSVVFLVSDFLCSGHEASMRVISRRHDLIAASISDPREWELPAAGLVELEDAETGRWMLLDASSRSVQRRYAALAEARAKALREQLRGMGIDQIDVRTDRDYVKALVAFFRARGKRAQYA